jgi:hypothetical protein
MKRRLFFQSLPAIISAPAILVEETKVTEDPIIKEMRLKMEALEAENSKLKIKKALNYSSAHIPLGNMCSYFAIINGPKEM